MQRLYLEKASVKDVVNFLYDLYCAYCKELSQYSSKVSVLPIQEFINTWINSEYGVAYLIKNPGNYTIGFILAEFLEKGKHEIKKDTLYIAEFYVEPKYRMFGIGTEAFRQLLKQYYESLGFIVLKQNSVAKSFWENQVSKRGLILEKRPDLNCLSCFEDADAIFIKERECPLIKLGNEYYYLDYVIRDYTKYKSDCPKEIKWAAWKNKSRIKVSSFIAPTLKELLSIINKSRYSNFKEK